MDMEMDMENGNGKWKIENGNGKLENVKLKMENGKCMKNGKWNPAEMEFEGFSLCSLRNKGEQRAGSLESSSIREKQLILEKAA